MSSPRPFLTGILLIACCLPSYGAVRAWLDSNQVAAGDTVQLTLEEDGQMRGQPDLSPLKRDFDVLGTSSSSSIQIINGQASSNTQLIVTLSPKSDGHLTVPSIAWGSDHTPVLSLDVSSANSGASPPGGGSSGNSASGAPAGQGQPATAKAFLETQIDKSDPYVQAGVNVTVRLYAAEPLRQVNLGLPQSPDALVMQVGPDSNSSVERNARRYLVLTRHYTVFPQRSGNVQLPGPTVDAQAIVHSSASSPFDNDPFQGFSSNSPFNSMLSFAKPVRLHGDPITLTVRPRPPNTATDWIPAEQVTLDAHWNPDTLRVHAGDPITLNLELRARGLTAEQLPDLAGRLVLPAGVKAYPDQATFHNTADGDTVVGTRSQSIAVIADEAGQYTIAAMHVRWWDLTANQLRELTLPERQLNILPAVHNPANEPDRQSVVANRSPPASARIDGTTLGLHTVPRNTGAETFWRAIALGSALLWIATVCVWTWVRRRDKKTRRSDSNVDPASAAPSESQARAAFREACRRNDALAARRSLINWVIASQSGPAKPSGLNALAHATKDPHLATLLRDLDRACFTGAVWNGDALMRALNKSPLNEVTPIKGHAKLASLYP